MWICDSTLEIILPHTSSTCVERILPFTYSTCEPTLHHPSFNVIPLVVCQLCAILFLFHVDINDNISSKKSPFVIDGNFIFEILPLSMCSYRIHFPLIV
jgi:hypothetical protein